MTRIVLTGAGGFIGAHVLRHLLTETDWQVAATDSFRHKGITDRIVSTLDGLPGAARTRAEVYTHDLSAPLTPRLVAQMGGTGGVDYVIAMASLSHVDDSIADPVSFTTNNVAVILNTLEACRAWQPAHVIVISTDEVYGPVPAGHTGHAEWAAIVPSNPYSASKAAQEAIAIAYWRTYGLPVTIINAMNLIGEMQGSEKYLPSLIRNISLGREVTVHGEPGNIGSRHYLHARNLADALLFLLRHCPPHRFGDGGQLLDGREVPARWNIVGPDRQTNLDLAEHVAAIIGEPLRYRLENFHATRPGHDPHYGLDPAKLTAAGWTPPVPFAESLERTVKWSLAHPSWLGM